MKKQNEKININGGTVEFIRQDKKMKKVKLSKENKKIHGRIRCNYKQLDKFLKFKGYEPIRQGSSTHVIYKSNETGKSIPVPKVKGTIPQGTIARMMTEINSSTKELSNHL